MLPRLSEPIAPQLPQSTSSRAGGSLTMVSKKSAAAATSPGDFASLAPAATSSSAREGGCGCAVFSFFFDAGQTLIGNLPAEVPVLPALLEALLEENGAA